MPKLIGSIVLKEEIVFLSKLFLGKLDLWVWMRQDYLLGVPNKTLVFKGENCNYSKLSKEYIILLVGANMVDSEKQLLLMIEISANDRCTQ